MAEIWAHSDEPAVLLHQAEALEATAIELRVVLDELIHRVEALRLGVEVVAESHGVKHLLRLQ